MVKQTILYYAFVIVIMLILVSLPALVGSVDPWLLIVVLIGISLLWPLLRILLGRRSQEN